MSASEQPTPHENGPCPNCGELRCGPYCHRCGQRAQSIQVSLGKLVRELVEELFGWDGRVFRTLGVLLAKPGGLTRAYLLGQRRRYTSPLRLFVAVLLVSLIPLFVLQQVAMFEPTTFKADLHFSTHRGGVNVQVVDGRADPPDSPVDTGWPWLNTHVERQMHKLNQSKDEAPALLLDAFASQAPRAIALMVPMLALLLKLFYRRRFIAEHLIMSLHVHTIALLAWLCGLLLWWVSVADVVLLLALQVYIVVAVKRVYDEPWRKTLGKYVGLGLGYSFVVILGTVAMVFVVLLTA